MNYKINNHLKVTLTKKATGESVVLYDDTGLQNGFDGVNYTSRPQGQDGKLSAAPPFVESVDDQFFSAVLVLNESSQSLYDIFDPVKVEVTSNGKTTTQHYLVGGNGTALQDARNTTCEKTINLIEPTKILTRYPIFNLNLTSKKDTLLRQFEKALNNSVLLLDDDECPFALSEELTEMLTGLPSEDFFFSDTNLYAVLFEMLSVIDCRPFVKKVEVDSLTKNFKTIVIDALKMSETHDEVFTPSTDQTKPEENHGVYISQERSNDGNDYMGKIVARGYNSISNAPLIVTDVFKTDEDTLTKNNATAFLPFPIEKINFFGVSGSVVLEIKNKSSGHTDDRPFTIKDIDISQAFVTSDEYASMNASEMNTHMPYDVGGQIIGASGKAKVLWGVKYNLDVILSSGVVKDAIWKQYLPGGSEISELKSVWLNIDESYFVCKYIPRIDAAIESSKPAVYDIDRLRLGIQDTQSANTIDIVRHGKNIEGLVRRTGNDEITMDMLVEIFDQVYPLMTRFVGGDFDDYVIWQREYSVASQNIKVRYSLTKGFNRVATKLGVKRERRIFAIPTASEDCPLIIKHYAVFSTETPTSNSVKSFINTDTYLKEFANNLLCGGVRETAYSIENVAFFTKEAQTNYENQGATLDGANEVLLLPCAGYSSGKAINFVAQPLDNYSAGYQLGKKVKFSIWGGGGTKILYTPYCDQSGECEEFTADICGAFASSDTNLADITKKLPVISYANGNLVGREIKVKYYKDRTQRPVFFFNIECVPSEADFGKVVIGEKFTQENFLLSQNKDKHDAMYLYVSNERYTESDTKCKGTRLGLVKDFMSLNIAYVPSFLSFKMTEGGVETAANQSHNSWAIGNASKDLFVAVNNQLPLTENATTLTIQFRKTTELGR